MATHSLVGRELGNYHVERLIGEGGMGAVFEARHRFLGDRVAVKVLHGSYSQNTGIAQRFFQEAKSARDIGHPSIIKVFDFGQADDGSLYLVMELLEGQSLASVLEAGPLPEDIAARIAAAVAEGLAAAHEKGVIHRDLKPDNIFVVGDGVKILDFGIAKVVSQSGNTNTNALLGTPKYMAPEQARGAKFVGPYSDIWALGVILFQMITGHLPFEGTEVIEIILKITTEEAPKPSRFKRVSPAMEDIILRCLAKDHAQRPASMDELRGLLAFWAGPVAQAPLGVTVGNTGVGLPARTSTTLGGSAGEKMRKSQPGLLDRKKSPVPTWAIAGGIGVLAIGGLGVYSLKRGLSGGVGAAVGENSAPPAVVVVAKPKPVEEIKEERPVEAKAVEEKTAEVKPVEEKPVVEQKAAAPAVEAAIVELSSEPPGAQVFEEGQLIGETPLRIEVKKSLPVNYVLKSDGYKDAAEKIAAAGEHSVKLQKKVVKAAGSKPKAKGTGGEKGAAPKGAGFDE